MNTCLDWKLPIFAHTLVLEMELLQSKRSNLIRELGQAKAFFSIGLASHTFLFLNADFDLFRPSAPMLKVIGAKEQKWFGMWDKD